MSSNVCSKVNAQRTEFALLFQSVCYQPDNSIRADDEFRLGVPLMVGDVVPRPQPYPLLPFGEKTVVARSSFAHLHHCHRKTHDGINNRR
jgi:hypothetical protein